MLCVHIIPVQLQLKCKLFIICRQNSYLNTFSHLKHTMIHAFFGVFCIIQTLINSDQVRSGLVRLYCSLIFLSLHPQIYTTYFCYFFFIILCYSFLIDIYIRNKLNLFCYLFQISMYPELNEYISEVLKSVKTIILANQMERLSLLIMDSTLKAVEKLSFNKIYINSFKNKRYLINLFVINSVIYIVAWIAKWL